MKDFGVVETDFNKMYQFLMAVAKYPNSRVSEQAMKYLGMADDPARFPKSVNNVYEELISLEEVQNQIRADSRRDNSNAAGSVHITSGKQINKAKSSDGSVGKMSQVLSAHAAVNKSLKKKFEQKHQSNSSYGGNPFTEARIESEMLRTGSSYQDVRKGMGPCPHCNREGHLGKDCRARAGTNKTNNFGPRSNSGNSQNRGSFRPRRPQSSGDNRNSNNSKSSSRPFKRAGVHSAVGSGARRRDYEDGEVSESELSNWKASVYSLHGRIITSSVAQNSDSDSMPELISNSDSSSSDEESTSAGNKRTNNNDISLFTRLTNKFLSQQDADQRAEGSSPPNKFVDQYLSSTIRAAIAYGAHIPASNSNLSGFDSSTQKDVQTYGLDIDKDVVANKSTYLIDEPTERMSKSLSKSPKKVEFTQNAQESHMRNSECTYNRFQSPPPPDMCSSATDSDASYRFQESDVEQSSEVDPEVMKSYDFIGERQSQPYCIVIDNSNMSNLVEKIYDQPCTNKCQYDCDRKRMRQSYTTKWCDSLKFTESGQFLGARAQTASAFTTNGKVLSDSLVADETADVSMQSDEESEPNTDEHVTPPEYHRLLLTPTTHKASDYHDESLPEPKYTDYPFPTEGFRCLMIADRVMVRFEDGQAVSSWILARESNIPEIRRRWDSAVAFLTSGLDQLEEEEIGICFDYCRGSSHRAHGVFLPDEDPEGHHLGPNGEFLGRVRINNWLIAYGVWEFQFTLPSMAQTWAELEYLYRRVFPRHPFFNSDHS
jgi:hypothetical protein